MLLHVVIQDANCCDCGFSLKPNEQYLGYYNMARTSYIPWDDNDSRFILDQHALLDFYSASSLKQQSAD